VGRVTIKDLARASGFSVCTINKALNGKPWVSEPTRRRILTLAAEMGYQPNRLAQALARRTLSLAVVYPKFWANWFSPLVDGVKRGVEALQDHNITARFCQVDCPPGNSDFLPTITELVRDGIDGLVFCTGGYSLQRTRETAELLAGVQIPVVLLGGDNPDLPHFTCVRVDTHRCGQMANELLGLATGSKPAAIFLGMRTDVNHWTKVEGFRAVHVSTTCPLVDVYETYDDPEIAYEMTARLFREHPETAGIYVAIDNSSPDVCRYLIDHGLAGKVKVVATGVFPEIGALMQRGIVHYTLFQNTVEQGRLAVRTLFRYLTESTHPGPEVLVPPYIAINSNFDLW